MTVESDALDASPVGPREPESVVFTASRSDGGSARVRASSTGSRPKYILVERLDAASKVTSAQAFPAEELDRLIDSLKRARAWLLGAPNAIVEARQSARKKR